ncbi:helix-turn-helix domain-containing protein [Agarivorans sp. B2Z047]|uniref:helix-turn-helix domain-containing protein n=1 Tax=Agarivorans sp. B2Z047 TaxID=2652721 RepID=UPI00128D9EE7|nr:helix-turn-helix domain-containing protein [Agarivorans sp. B2Z047]MPW30962.1 helix-turn-helix domain-containing protein [Agarivorans sp. B2Z047]UQN40811.1 helix-turn-helix domain-containing protein [Agarivorans sp. B2Z047]
MVANTQTNGDSLLCTIHSNDANHQAANLVNWQQEFDQLSQGRFVGQINEINFPNIHVFREDTNQELRQQCRVEEGGLWIGFSSNQKSCRINNQTTRHSQFLCRPGSLDFELLTPEHFSIYGLVLHKSLFSQLEEQQDEPIISQSFYSLWLDNIPANTLQTFQQYLSQLLQTEGSRWSSNTQALILEDAVLNLLSQAQKPAVVSHPALDQRQRIMQRVKSYLTESRLKNPITVSELCAAVHVSRRTLQYTFSQCCDMTPKQYIQIIRLNQVRRALLNSQHQQTIAEVAFDYGFFHLGQFCRDYKRLFCETPSETRRREFA